MKFILGTKSNMTQVFQDDGTVVPVTRVQAGPCVVTQVKQKGTNQVNSVQIGFGSQQLFRVNKAQQGHLKGLDTVRVMREVATGDEDHGLLRGDRFTVSTFSVGDKVHVQGRSKGKGFQGVVKRWGFAGSLKTHGHKDQHRMPGSIGATGPARVFKGTRMGGHMGDDVVTVKNLEIVQIDEENNELLIKGAVPGARGGLLLILCPEGKIDVEKAPEPEATTLEEEKTEDTDTVAPEDTDTKEEENKNTEETPAEATDASAPTTEDAEAS